MSVTRYTQETRRHDCHHYNDLSAAIVGCKDNEIQLCDKDNANKSVEKALIKMIMMNLHWNNLKTMNLREGGNGVFCLLANIGYICGCYGTDS